jgi:serine/threonine protein kinase
MVTPLEPEPVTSGRSLAPACDEGSSGQPHETLFVGPINRPDEYELVGEGHKGGEGIVFVARYHGRLPRPVTFAVKQLVGPPRMQPETWPDPELLDRWREQLRVLQRVRHDHLVRYHELVCGWPPHPEASCAGEPPPTLRTWYLVMEWIEGPSLHAVVRSGKTDLQAVAKHIVSLAEAVEHLHTGADTEGMVLLHRDIKPGNVIVQPERGAVLVDYGLLRVEEPTLTELPAWTGPYLAPEVHADKTRTSRASDLWAVAATAFFCVTGQQPSPFDPTLMRRQLAVHLKGQVDAPASVTEALMEVLERAPEDRPTSPKVWASRLEAAIEGAPNLAADPGTESPGAQAIAPGARRVERPFRRKGRTLRPVWAALLAGIVVLGAVTAVGWRVKWPPRLFGVSQDLKTPSRAIHPSRSPTTTTTIPGTVDITQVAGNQFATQVSEVLQTYFMGIDSQNYSQAYAVYSPAEQANVGYQSWVSALSTTKDSAVTVVSITQNPDGSLSVNVNFTSHQSPSQGPTAGESCTNWSLEYTLMSNSAGTLPYLIDSVAPVGLGDQVC